MLAEEGYIESEEADYLREMAKQRNAAVHGDFSVDVPAAHVERMLEYPRSIASDIINVIPEQNA